MSTRSFISAVALSAVLASALVAVPAAAAQPDLWNTAWSPSATADGTTIPAVNSPSGTWKAPASTARSSSNARVAAASVGAPGLGALPYFAFDKTELSLNVAAQVNLGNGNLLLTASDGVLNGAGLALRNDRFYNGLSAAPGSYGAGWSSSLSQVDTGLSITSTDVTYRGATGFSAKFTKSGSSFTAPAGFAATLTTNAASTDQRYTLKYNSSGETLTFSASGYITSDKDRNGVGTTYTYNSSSQVSVVTTASGRTFTIVWASDTSTLINSIVDSAGRRTSYNRDATGNMTSVVRIDGTTETYTYDSAGRIATITTPNQADPATGQVTTFGYDTSHRVTSVKRASVGAPTTVLASTAYAYASGTTTVTDGNGKVSTYSIDSSGRVSSAKDALNRTRSQTWTANSDIQTTTDALGAGSTPGNLTTYSYDELNNATSVSYPTGAAASATYSQGTSCPGAGSGNPYQAKCSSDDAGNGKSFEYDAAGNPTKTTDTTAGGTGAVTEQKTYDNVNRSVCGGFAGQVCTSTNAIGGVTRYAYNGSGDLLSVTPPAPMGATTYTYDSLGRVLSVTDGNGQATTYSYNVRDDILVTHFADGQDLVAQFYPSGLVQQERDTRQGVGVKDYSYDTLGRLVGFTGPEAGTRQSYTYDKVGNTLTYTDQNGRVTYAYDAGNQLTTVTEPGGVCTTGTTNPAAGSGCIKFTYDNNGAENKRTFPGGANVVTVNDASARPTRITAKDAAGAIATDIGYSYGVGGSTTKADDRLTIQQRISYKEVGITAGAITGYTYDSLSRLKSATEKAGTTTAASWAFGYDNAGNRTSQVKTGTVGITAGTTTYTYNTANQVTGSTGATSTYTYDGAGNQLTNGATGQTASYDSRLAVTSIGATGYKSFGQGNTSTLTRSAGTSSYSNSALGLMSETANAVTTAYTRTSEGAALGSRTSLGARSYFVLDSLGSVVGLFDGNGAFAGGYSYSPYGETRVATDNASVAANSLRYIAGYFDSATNLYKFGARYYDSAQGRFTQMDPSGQESNPYGYAGCNPVNASDPSGLLSIGCKLAITGAVVSVLGLAFSAASIVIGAFSAAPTGGLGLALVALGAAGFLTSGLGAALSAAGIYYSC